MSNSNDKLTAASIRYLLALGELDRDETGVKSSDIAQRLGITKPSVHTMIKRFAQKGYVTKAKYEAVHLTSDGRRLSEQYKKCFDLIYASVQTSLNLPAEDGQNAACAVLAETDICGLESLYLKLCGAKAAV